MLTCFDAGRLCDSSESYEGELDIPNLSEENDPEDVDVSRTSMIYFSDYIVCCMECRRGAHQQQWQPVSS